MIKKAEFVTSVDHYKKCPEGTKTEFAFIGRSNVGKSSLINMLCNNQKLSKTSSRPGKTQTINHFLINDQWYLVDLPGYGYAKTSKVNKAKWSHMIKEYLLNREQMMCLCILIDSRLEPQKIDIEFVNFVGTNGIPFILIFTKADKQSPNKTGMMVAKFKKTLLNYWDELPPYFITSSETTLGKEEVINFIETTISNIE